ncbi:efflux RND transporter periplasmic adaptor subunit [Bradyrhizobium sp.]|uniref:efflux RND transporter periplasmic adaptor subunit n=1 Tax=Bradyrhizobium sp. TaxID=376 RepID=UPI0039E4B992
MDQKVGTTSERPATTPAPPATRGSGLRTSLVAVLSLLVVAAIVWWTKHESAPQQGNGRAGGAPVSVVLGTVGKGDIGINLSALGSVTSLGTVTIKSQISGYLNRIVFKEGDEVKKGDLIAEIDSRPYEATLAQAKGQLARDEALLKGAQVDLTRYQNLAAQNAVPHQQLDTQVALVAQDQGTVEADKAAVQSAEVNLQYCHIVSPLDGRVGLRQVDQGNYVTPGDASGIVVITQLQPISVLFTLPEDNLQAVAKRLHDGATLPVTAYDRSGTTKLAEGTLGTFDSQIDQTTGTIKLRAQFPNEARTLYPNQFVNVKLLLDTHKGVTTIPTAGVQRGVPGTFVYLANDDGTVSVRKVQLGITDGDRVEVQSGLDPNQKIVIDGADKLREGAKIVARPATGTDAGASAAKGTTDPSKAGGQKHRSDGAQK